MLVDSYLGLDYESLGDLKRRVRWRQGCVLWVARLDGSGPTLRSDSSGRDSWSSFKPMAQGFQRSSDPSLYDCLKVPWTETPSLDIWTRYQSF